MRLGDYVLCINLALNAAACSAYAYQGHYKQAVYWVGVGGSGGDIGKLYADQGRVVNAYPSQESCERAKTAVENPLRSGSAFVCVEMQGKK